jgi:hypothetical protein
MPCIRRLRIIALATLLSTSSVTVAADAAEHTATAKADVAGEAKRKHAEAARAFYDADALAPSSDALGSAIAAARLANDHLLVAQAAQRAIAREGSDAKLAGDARAALAEAELHLARVDLACSPAPCELSIEGAAVAAGRQYLLPGTHLFVATYAAASDKVEQRATLAAGSLYTIALSPVSEPAAPSSPQVAHVRTPVAAAHQPALDQQPRRHKPLPKWTLFGGAAVSVALGGVTIWSGVDALSNVNRFKLSRTATDRSRATASVHRTDLLLAGTALISGLTVFAGLSLVDFGRDEQAVGVAPEPSGALVTWSGRL